MTSNIKNIKGILTENEIICLVIPDTGYEETLMEAAGSLGEYYNKILYISVNTPYEALTGKFKQNKINTGKFHFIDYTTMNVKEASPNKNCDYVSSPAALDEIHSKISDALNKQKIRLILIDSPSYLLIYPKHIDLVKFMHLLAIKVRIAECKGVFPFQKESAKSLRNCFEMLTDKTVNLEPDEVIPYT